MHFRNAGIREPCLEVENDFELRCKLAIIRHADRTCKQKVSLKFCCAPPAEYPLNEDIRSSSLISGMIHVVEGLRQSCWSDEAQLRNGLRILASGKDDLKVKIEKTDMGWTLKLKWGGNLTPLGMYQSEVCGIDFKRHIAHGLYDIMAFASGDLRCQQTASCFFTGLIGDSDFPIRSGDGPDGLGSLDDTPFRHSPAVEEMRVEISKILMSGMRIDNDFVARLFPVSCPDSTAVEALNCIRETYTSFARAVLHLKELIDDMVASVVQLDSSAQLYLSETAGLMASRWYTIWKAIHRTDGRKPNSASITPSGLWKSNQVTASGVLFSSIQVSLVGEIFDNAQYDYRHNFALVSSLDGGPSVCEILTEIRAISTLLHQVVTPLEYGISKADKAFVGASFLFPLIRKLRFDVRIACGLPLGDDEIHVERYDEKRTADRARYRFYFAHHSHLFSFISILSGSDLVPTKEFDVSSLGYLSEVLVSVYESKTQKKFKLCIDLFPGDDLQSADGSLEFRTINIVDTMFDSAADIDTLLTNILSIPANDARAPSHLPTIGESSSADNIESRLN